MLQLCRSVRISWADMVLASSVAGLFKWRQFEPEVILLAVGMVPAFFTVLPRCRGTLGRTRDFGRSRHALAVGTALCAGVGAAPAETAQGKKRFLAGRRNVRPSERQMGVLVPGCGFRGCDDRLLALGKAGRRRSKALPGQSAGRSELSDAASHQHRQACFLPAGDCATQSRGCSGGELLTSPVQYLNNVLEQDHRAIKRRVRASQHFRSFWAAWRTIAGYEAIHMIRKGQPCCSSGASVYCTTSFSVCSLRRTKIPIICPDLRLDYKLATHPLISPAVP